MTQGVGNSTRDKELQRLSELTFDVQPIQESEFTQRISKACQLMELHDIDAIYLHAGTNLFYFTGMMWGQSERMVGAVLTQTGKLHFIAPKFEEGTIQDFMVIKGDIHCWEEHESPYALFVDIVHSQVKSKKRIGLDESTPYFISNGIGQLAKEFELLDAKPITAGCRMQKSPQELAIMQTAMDMTIEVQKSIGAILYEGITAEYLCAFADDAHRVCGAKDGSYFCIVLFGPDSAFPHGVRKPKALDKNEVVLIDTGCLLHSYISDITRTYVFGEPSEEVKDIWQKEKDIQQIAFENCVTGYTCSSIDGAVREALQVRNLGPDYQLPGTSHRTGHGIGLNIHEWPYIVKYEKTVLEQGMTFSIEPMICVPGKFGIRLEDHVFMGDSHGKWFTEPSESILNPFNY
jgi:Xaa-Pro dipeptidase